MPSIMYIDILCSLDLAKLNFAQALMFCSTSLDENCTFKFT